MVRPMRRGLLRLNAFAGRRRRLILAIWAALLLAAVPFAARQSDRLTGGGWAAGGSDSTRAEKAIQREFPDSQAAFLALVLVPRPDARPDDLQTAAVTLRRKLAAVGGVRVSPASGL